MSDTERLIEEAGRVVAQAEKQSALDAKYPPCTCSAPPRGHTMRQHDYRRLRVDELRAVLSACGNLVTALRAERERADKATLEALELKQRGRSLELVSADAIRERDELAAGLRSANALYETCKIDRDEYAAANLAANKRIVALEHERDAARAELARLTTPRPIAEAPRDGTWVLGLWWGRAIPVVVQWTEGSGWTDGEYDLKPTRFLPLRFEERSPPEGARDDG